MREEVEQRQLERIDWTDVRPKDETARSQLLSDSMPRSLRRLRLVGVVCMPTGIKLRQLLHTGLRLNNRGMENSLVHFTESHTQQ